MFKTDVEPWQEDLVRNLLKDFQGISQLDLDFEDCDHILRIESDSNLSPIIQSLMRSKGYQIQELE